MKYIDRVIHAIAEAFNFTLRYFINANICKAGVKACNTNSDESLNLPGIA